MEDPKLRCCYTHFEEMLKDDAAGLGFRLCEFSKVLRHTFAAAPHGDQAEEPLFGGAERVPDKSTRVASQQR